MSFWKKTLPALLLTLFVINAVDSNSFAQNKNKEDLTSKISPEGCIQDLVSLAKLRRKTAGNSIQVTEAIGVDLTSPQNEEEFKNTLRAKFTFVNQCDQVMSKYCNDPEIDSVFAQLVRFQTDEKVSGIFPWTEKNKIIAYNSLKRKVCAGVISLDLIKNGGGIYFSNNLKVDSIVTARTGKKIMFPDNGDAFQPGFVTFISDDYGGFNFKKIPIIVMTASNLILGEYLITSSNFIQSLDITLIHEFAHYRVVSEDSYESQQNDFLDIAFEKKKGEFEKSRKVFMDDIIQPYFLALQENVGMTDQQKNEAATKFFARNFSTLDASLWYVPGLKVNSRPKRISLPYKLISKDSEIDFTKIFLPFSKENYSLTSGWEYFAESVMLYYYDRLAAQGIFTKSELELLKK